MHLTGRSISKVHLMCNDANQFFGEAFVVFGSLDDVERALEGIFGNKILNKYIRVFRSSKEQFRNYYSSMQFKSSMNGKLDRSVLAPNPGKYFEMLGISVYGFHFVILLLS